MSGVEELRALLERVEAARGPDRLMDAWIGSTLKDLEHESAQWARHWDGEWLAERGRIHLLNDAGERSFNFAPPAYTASIDAAIALAERVLPALPSWAKGSPPSSGWKINFYRGMTPTGAPHASWEASIRKHAGETKWSNAPTLPLAILAALLSAKIAEAESLPSPTVYGGER